MFEAAFDYAALLKSSRRIRRGWSAFEGRSGEDHTRRLVFRVLAAIDQRLRSALEKRVGGLHSLRCLVDRGSLAGPRPPDGRLWYSVTSAPPRDNLQ